MYRVSLDNVTVHRSCVPLYAHRQATPMDFFIDDAETGDIYSGMVLARTGEGTVGLHDGTSATQKPLGLAAIDRNAVINDMEGHASVPFAVWVGGPDAVFEIRTPAFDDGQAYAVPTDGSRALLYANTTGQITSDATGNVGGAVAELLEVPDAETIVVRVIPPGSAV